MANLDEMDKNKNHSLLFFNYCNLIIIAHDKLHFWIKI